MALTLPSLASAKTIAKSMGLIGLVIGLSACGQRGPLVPPSANIPAPDAQTEATYPDRESANPPKPDERFILDPLL